MLIHPGEDEEAIPTTLPWHISPKTCLSPSVCTKPIMLKKHEMHCRRLFLLKGSCWGTQLCQWLLCLWFPLNWLISSILRLNCTGCSGHFHYILQTYFISVVFVGSDILHYLLLFLTIIDVIIILIITLVTVWFAFYEFGFQLLGKAGAFQPTLKIRVYLCGKITLSKWKSTGCEHHRRLVPP